MNLCPPVLRVRAAVVASALVVLGMTSACEPSRPAPRPSISQDNSSMPPLRSSASPSLDADLPDLPGEAASRGVLLARPHAPHVVAPRAGRVPLGLNESSDARTARDGFLYVPKEIDANVPSPLVVFFHGAGGNAGQAEMIRRVAEDHHALVLALDSRGPTWDLIHDEIGPDVAFLDRALRWTFDRFAVDPAHVATAGFSDGASYAVSMGLANGELFSTVVAFSPGFSAAPEIHGKPRFFVSHGTKDAVLPIAPCSRRLVKALERAGYHVDYHEFDGPHTVPAEITRDAFAWLLG